MNNKLWLAAGVSAACVGAAAFGAAGAPAPVATYWVDAATTSGFGAGMSSGGQPNMAQLMRAMQGGGGEAQHTLELRLASKQKASGAAAADHLPPPSLAMGPRLPLMSPVKTLPAPSTPHLPSNFQRPQGRMLIYWGCGEHVSAGQPMTVDFAQMSGGKLPAGLQSMASMYAKVAQRPGPGTVPGYGEWPNDRDSRAVPASGSLLGAHRVEANYSPPISFTLGAGQDFMPALGLTDAGNLPSGATRLTWRPAPTATGYALAMFGSANGGDVLVWTSSRAAAMMALLDYLPPAEVKKLVASGAVLSPSTSECLLPAEVAKASPTGVIQMIGYGPEAQFREGPKAPKWTAKVRYKTTASLMRGMGGLDRAEAAAPGRGQPQPQPQKKKKRKFGLGDVLKSVPIPVPIP